MSNTSTTKTNLTPEEIEDKKSSDSSIKIARDNALGAISHLQILMKRPEQRWVYSEEDNPYLVAATHLIRFSVHGVSE